MSQINKMSMTDILKYLHLILRDGDVVHFLTNSDLLPEFLEMFNSPDDASTSVKQFLIDHERDIDKERLILLLVKNNIDELSNIENQLNNFPADPSQISSDSLSKFSELQINRDVLTKNLKKCVSLAKGINQILTFYHYDEKTKKHRVDVIDSREFIDGQKINKSKNLKRFDEIDDYFQLDYDGQQLGFEFILQSLLLTDFYRIFPNEQFGNCVRTMILENEVLKRHVKSIKELNQLKTLEHFDEYTELLDSTNFEGMLPDIKSALRDYVQYVDLDKLLLISAFRFSEGLETAFIKEKSNYSIRAILLGILDSIKKPNAKISCELQIKNKDYEMELIEYSVDDLKRCISKFTSNGHYIRDEEIEDYKEQILDGTINLSELPNEYAQIVFTPKELESLSSMSDINFIEVFKNLNWDSEKLLRVLKRNKSCGPESLLFLIENEYISQENVLHLYEQNIISLESIQKISNKVSLSGIIDFEQLNSAYQNSRKNPQQHEIFNKYLDLYKTIFINTKSDKDIEDASNIAIEKIVENFNGKEYDDAIKAYFSAGIITLDSIADWSNRDLITLLYNDGLLTLTDLEELAQKQKLDYNYLSTIYITLLNNPDLNYNERLSLIRKGFIPEEYIFDLFKQNLIFEEDLKKLAEDGFVRKLQTKRLISSRTMEELERNSSIVLTGLNSLQKKVYEPTDNIHPSPPTKPTGKFIIDPDEREKFIKSLNAYRAITDLEEDSPFYNYEFYVMADESGDIGLNSVVIAERYFEDKDTECRFALNNATYFFKYKDLMVLSNLNKSEMTKERQNIVFTANHVLANKKREGRWAKSVLSSLVKTMLSSDLKEYSKENQKAIIFSKLNEVYGSEQLKEILDIATEIDFGEHICGIEEPVSPRRNSKKSVNTSNEDNVRE